MLTTIALEIVFSILGAIVVSWFSRKREFRADAGAAQLAGSSSMIAALVALKRASESEMSSQQDGESQSSHSPVAAFQISNNKSSFLSLFATHPPLEDRIQALKQNSHFNIH